MKLGDHSQREKGFPVLPVTESLGRLMSNDIRHLHPVAWLIGLGACKA
jgi:hypothetical protein